MLYVCHGDDAGPRFDPCRLAATGDAELPALKLPDGTVITHSRDILASVSQPR
jgi:hypothetical protein